jgi:hypothetical protein
MPRSKLPSLNSIKDGSFEPNRKNAISLGDDSVLSADSKPIKIGEKSSILELSEDSLIIRGAIEFDTLLRGILNSPNERMAFTAKTGEYRWYSTDNDEDYVRMFVLGGNCLLQSVDASGGTEADINLDAGNDIILDAGSGNITAKDDGGNYTPSSDYHVATKKYVDDNAGGASALNDLSDVTYSSGDLTISSLDKIVASGALELESGGVLTFNNNSTTRITFENSGSAVARLEAGQLFLKEEGSASSDSAAFGQIWIKDDTPNCLSFTDDAGTDIVGIGKYHYETKFIGFYAGQTSQYIPMTGYIIEKTSTASNNEFISFVTPYNCTIEKFIYRSEVAQDGNLTLTVWESSDGTETPGTRVFAKANAVDIADDTFVDLDLTSPTIGSDYAPLTKGKIYAISLTTPSSGYDTNITVVFKWDITS